MKARKFKQFQHINILWEDSAFIPGWGYEEIPIPATVQSTGYVLETDKAGIILTGHLRTNRRGALNPQRIPWGCISKIVKVK